MKETRTILNGLVACGIGLALMSTVVAQTANDGVATVVRINGNARYTTGNNLWQPLKPGMQLHAGTVVQTGLDKGSYVDLVFGGANVPAMVAPIGPSAGGRFAGGNYSFAPATQQNAVHIYENSLLGIDRLTSLDTGAEQVTETQLDLKQGRMLGNVKKMSAASKYEIKLPNGVVGVRGTVYDISADGLVQVRSGSTVVAWTAPDGATKTQVVMAGEQFDIRTGQISRLAPDTITSMDYAVNQMQAGLGAPITYTADHTVYFLSVSPTSGIQGGF